MLTLASPPPRVPEGYPLPLPHLQGGLKLDGVAQLVAGVPGVELLWVVEEHCINTNNNYYTTAANKLIQNNKKSSII